MAESLDGKVISLLSHCVPTHGLSVRDISLRIARPTKSIAVVMRRLAAKGQIVRCESSGRPRYRLPVAATENP